MDCPEIRQRLLAAPEDGRGAFERHLLECRDCADFAAGLLRLDHQLADVTRVRIPEGLSARVLLRRSWG